jgi:hypothetical protein
VSSSIPGEVFREFISGLKGDAAEIMNSNFTALSLICEELLLRVIGRATIRPSFIGSVRG